MLIGKDGPYEKPTHPCIVPGCKALSFQEDKGACKKHMFDKIEWLRRRVMLRASTREEVAS